MTWNPSHRRVLVPVDFSEASLEAVRAALSLVSDPRHITALHVVNPPPVMTPGVVWDSWNDATALARVRSAMGDQLGDVRDAGVRLEAAVGFPAETIVDWAAEHDNDLIVIPSHGRRGLKRWVLGSVAERVVRHAPCAVLVLRRSDMEETNEEEQTQ